MIRTVRNIVDLPKTVKIIDRSQAFKLISDAGVTQSGTKRTTNPTQMLNVWVNDKNTQLDCYKVTGGRVEERGLYFRLEDVELFIQYKTMTFKDFKKMVKNGGIGKKEEKEIVIPGQQTIHSIIFEEEESEIKVAAENEIPVFENKFFETKCKELGLVQFPKESPIEWVDFSTWNTKGVIVAHSNFLIENESRRDKRRERVTVYLLIFKGKNNPKEVEMVLDVGMPTIEDFGYFIDEKKEEEIMQYISSMFYGAMIDAVNSEFGDFFEIPNIDYEIDFEGYKELIEEINDDEEKYEKRTILE